ncbi:hypothetical protein PHLCEN_2v6701 [Hermanssonia centrifuga]|uniref:Uncharacterized protein n=1 Tax=Hermanssonia centrifuga TaxID=98765 RepID=A0A2R6NYN3_9APHY|nr:hypothetical protein PHLCEN_2v6701 [Hermanssonia centrifuga]
MNPSALPGGSAMNSNAGVAHSTSEFVPPHPADPEASTSMASSIVAGMKHFLKRKTEHDYENTKSLRTVNMVRTEAAKEPPSPASYHTAPSQSPSYSESF